HVCHVCSLPGMPGPWVASGAPLPWLPLFLGCFWPEGIDPRCNLPNRNPVTQGGRVFVPTAVYTTVAYLWDRSQRIGQYRYAMYTLEVCEPVNEPTERCAGTSYIGNLPPEQHVLRWSYRNVWVSPGPRFVKQWHGWSPMVWPLPSEAAVR